MSERQVLGTSYLEGDYRGD